MALAPFLLAVVVCGYYFEWFQDDGKWKWEKQKDLHGKDFSHVLWKDKHSNSFSSLMSML
ncbi:hypothetical protein BCV53_04185 [Parageobacillus thermoglucosidasius]|uniref:Uncharacterized protein n=1 Tax=Parageobacillus thermoglucosidasius TaxID=1426 RepID=A0AAN0YLP9_PARTM|nr:hypothetical protein AOT13_04170 [Parageobacillus thermoglucosidasius]GAJ43442.1 hypothetical protein GT2_10_00020 [Parageobacillus thermoglucosidasius NBRC 107763]ANZ29372.1 hypothetical protein BCV53_04185 [Parageobacillus thermoglucosidasius]APM80111.1 hypothetical protein BCV54_04190 [Parageobacillus thermoglucosidasius]KJX67417.1 hypothetical protein WH82_17960 [Parageobacillus thermoglucosidasius]